MIYYFLLINTIPCYYKIFNTINEAEKFGFALRQLGEIELEKYRYKIYDKKPKCIDRNRFNGYELIEMSDELYNRIIGELNRANFKML